MLNIATNPGVQRVLVVPDRLGARRGPMSQRHKLALLVHASFGPPLEAFHLPLRPGAITGHRTIPQAFEDRGGVLLDLVVRRQVKRPSHGFVVHRTEQRLDVLLEAHPFFIGGHNITPLRSAVGEHLPSRYKSTNRLPEEGPKVPQRFSGGLAEHSRCADRHNWRRTGNWATGVEASAVARTM